MVPSHQKKDKKGRLKKNWFLSILDGNRWNRSGFCISVESDHLFWGTIHTILHHKIKLWLGMAVASTTRLANRSLSELVGDLFGVTPREAIATGTLQLAMHDFLWKLHMFFIQGLLCSVSALLSILSLYMSILYHSLNGHQEIATGHPRGGGSGLFWACFTISSVLTGVVSSCPQFCMYSYYTL